MQKHFSVTTKLNTNLHFKHSSFFFARANCFWRKRNSSFDDKVYTLPNISGNWRMLFALILAVRRFSSAQPFRKRYPLKSNKYDEELCNVCASSCNNNRTISAQFSQILSQLKSGQSHFYTSPGEVPLFLESAFFFKKSAYCNSARSECFSSVTKISCLKVTSKVTQSCHLLSFLTFVPFQETSKFLE